MAPLADSRGDDRDPIAAFLAGEAERGSWPGAVWIVEERGRTVSAGAVGSRSLLPERLPAEDGTIYDLASLTKPLATAALLAMLQDEGRLDLDDPAERYVPGLACAGSGGRPTLRDLALHRSGLPAWRPFYLDATSPEEILRRVVAVPAEAPCGSRVLYSDPGYVLLGEVLRTVSGGKDIAALFAERIADPLGLDTLGFLRPVSRESGARKEDAPSAVSPDAKRRDRREDGRLDVAPLLERIAPTEDGNGYERELAARRAVSREGSSGGRAEGVPDAPRADEPVAADAPSPARFRTSLIHGEVHDGNAHALGGAAGHAGLFGTAGDVARLARQFVTEDERAPIGHHRPRLFGRRALDLFRQNGTPGLEEARSVGWKLARAGCREAEGVLSPDSFGHTGFTGTSLYLDPVSGRIYVLLTNRVHPRVRPIDMNGLRRRFHEIASRLP